MTTIIQTAPLAAHAQTQCSRCAGTIWVYTTHAGVQFALDDAPGPVVIDALGKAFKTGGRDGYREHECKPTTDPSPRNEVADDDFLWP
jgi:hypothetical protein